MVPLPGACSHCLWPPQCYILFCAYHIWLLCVHSAHAGSYPGVIERYVNLISTAPFTFHSKQCALFIALELTFSCAHRLSFHGIMEGRKISGRMKHWASIRRTA